MNITLTTSSRLELIKSAYLLTWTCSNLELLKGKSAYKELFCSVDHCVVSPLIWGNTVDSWLSKIIDSTFWPNMYWGSVTYSVFGRCSKRTWPALLLSICTWFLKSVFHEIDLWTWLLSMIFCLFQTWFLLPVYPAKIKFKIYKKSSSNINFVK